jgi:hypothetical protein
VAANVACGRKIAPDTTPTPFKNALRVILIPFYQPLPFARHSKPRYAPFYRHKGRVFHKPILHHTPRSDNDLRLL